MNRKAIKQSCIEVLISFWASLYSDARSFGLTIISVTTEGITNATCQSVKICNIGEKGASIAARAAIRTRAANVLALSSPTFIA